jgi:hypothetical protein
VATITGRTFDYPARGNDYRAHVRLSGAWQRLPGARSITVDETSPAKGRRKARLAPLCHPERSSAQRSEVEGPASKFAISETIFKGRGHDRALDPTTSFLNPHRIGSSFDFALLRSATLRMTSGWSRNRDLRRPFAQYLSAAVNERAPGNRGLRR